MSSSFAWASARNATSAPPFRDARDRGDRMAAIDAVKGNSTRFALGAAERALVNALGSGDMPPYLGHNRLPPHIALKLRDEIRCGVGRIEIRLRLLFYLWPALTTAWIAQTVAERYGTIAQMEVYPHLSALLGVPNLDPNSRIRMAKLFRRACTRLDLPLPEAVDAVDAYVVQGGVPHTQIDRLADALVKAERRVGLPDVDDDLAVARFTDLAACAVDAGHPRLRKVLEHDTVGWYVRLWTMLRERPEDAPDDAFVRLLAEAASANANAPGAGLRRPCLAWREGLLAVEIPEGQSRLWALAAEGWRQEVAGQAAPVVVALPLPWPSALEWQAGSLVRRRADVGTLEPPAREWVAVFAATGRLVTRAQFHSPDELMRPVRLARGAYDLVCSTRFMGPEGIEASAVPGGYHLRIEIGEWPLKLLRGSRSITLAAVQQPELKLLGPGVCDLHGRTIYGERGLSVRVIWPQIEDEHDLSEVEEEPAEASGRIEPAHRGEARVVDRNSGQGSAGTPDRPWAPRGGRAQYRAASDRHAAGAATRGPEAGTAGRAAVPRPNRCVRVGRVGAIRRATFRGSTPCEPVRRRVP